MGAIISQREMNTASSSYRLIIYSKAGLVHTNAVSINKLLAEKLIKIKPSRRTFQLEKCFHDVIASLPDDTIIKNFDVMFNPQYKVDVLKILISANKQKPIRVLWPGQYSDGKLIYSNELLPDYRVYEISEYDILCVV